MSISQYRRWYELVYAIPCPLSDEQIKAFSYYLEGGV